MRGYRNAMNAAEAQARTEAERRLAGAFEHIASGLDQLRGSLKAVEDSFEAEAVEVALAVGKKLAATLIAREPFAEAAALADHSSRERLGARIRRAARGDGRTRHRARRLPDRMGRRRAQTRARRHRARHLRGRRA